MSEGSPDQVRYSERYIRFVLAHLEAFHAAYVGGDPAGASHELQRLAREYATLPSRHSCSCWGHHCLACRKLAEQRTRQDVAVEIGRGATINPPMPDALLLDLARARKALGERGATPRTIARYLNGEGSR